MGYDREEIIKTFMLDNEQMFKDFMSEKLIKAGHSSNECEQIIGSYQYLLLFCRDYPQYDPIDDIQKATEYTINFAGTKLSVRICVQSLHDAGRCYKKWTCFQNNFACE